MEKVQLKPNHQLMNPEFEGYKLSLDTVPVYQSDIGNRKLGVRLLNEDQYSYLHVKLLGGYNCLVEDPFYDQNQVFIIDGENESILQAKDCSIDGRNPEIAEVWTSPEPPSVASGPLPNGEYNPSISFPSLDKAVFTDGRGTFYILKTGNRENFGNQWGISFKDEVCGKKQPYTLVSSSMNDKTLHCLVQYVDEGQKVLSNNVNETKSKVNFINVIEWLTFVESESGWGLDRVRKFAFFGGIDYIMLKHASGEGERSDDAYFMCITDKPFKLIYDSAGMMLEDEIENGKVEELLQDKKKEEKRPMFYWFQGVEDMVVWVMLPDVTNKKDIKVVLKPSEISVMFKGQELFGGKLWNILDSDSMTWTIQKDGKLEITFSKANVGMIWQRFLKQHDPNEVIDGEEVMDPGSVDKIHAMFSETTEAENKLNASEEKEHANINDTSLLYNAQELDDCDEAPEEASVLYLFNVGLDGKISHYSSFSGRKWLFNIPLGKDNIEEAPRFCLRHDVDGLVWSPLVCSKSKEGKPNTLTLEHTGSFAALGYVQASKQQRKFTCSASDLSYVAIIDRIRHLYIYRQPSDIADGCELRNRTTGQKVKKVAKQQVVTLQDTNEEIIGAFASSKTLFIATKSSLFAITVEQ